MVTTAERELESEKEALLMGSLVGTWAMWKLGVLKASARVGLFGLRSVAWPIVRGLGVGVAEASVNVAVATAPTAALVALPVAATAAAVGYVQTSEEHQGATGMLIGDMNVSLPVGDYYTDKEGEFELFPIPEWVPQVDPLGYAWDTYKKSIPFIRRGLPTMRVRFWE